MPQKSKTGGSPKKVEKPKDQKEQSARFIEAARKIGVDESGREFERALRKIVPAKQK
jgi:hypothetical protein